MMGGSCVSRATYGASEGRRNMSADPKTFSLRKTVLLLLLLCFYVSQIAEAATPHIASSSSTVDLERKTSSSTALQIVGSAKERRREEIIQRKQKARKQRIELRSQKFLDNLTRLNQEFKGKREIEVQKQLSGISNTKRGGVLIQRSFKPSEVQSMKKEEGEQTVRCSFAAADCSMEIVEHDLVRRFIRKNDSVLELGARFGTTSCEIAAQLGNSGQQVSVEPDNSVWYILEENQITHHCSFWQYRGVVTDHVVLVNPASYATRTSTSMNDTLSSSSSSSSTSNRQNHDASTLKLPAVTAITAEMAPRLLDNLSLEALQQQVGFRFSVLLIDCEGCIESLFQNDGIGLKDSLKDVTTIIIEGDMSVSSPHCKSDCVDYEKWLRKFVAMGYLLSHRAPDNVFKFMEHFVLQKKTS